jgi:hypothetical protein
MPDSSSSGPTRYRPRAFPAAVSARLRTRLAWSHADRPFAPADVRDAAGRAAAVARDLGLDAVLVRGGVDVGGAELDHVWVVAEGRVVDVALPLRSEAFACALREYVAGHLDAGTLDRLAHGYTLTWRVVGEFPPRLRYVGEPVWHERRPA